MRWLVLQDDSQRTTMLIDTQVESWHIHDVHAPSIDGLKELVTGDLRSKSGHWYSFAISREELKKIASDRLDIRPKNTNLEKQYEQRGKS